MISRNLGANDNHSIASLESTAHVLGNYWGVIYRKLEADNHIIEVERKFVMIESTIQIITLDSLHVAAITINDKSPEEIAIHALLDWARPQGLLDQKFRFFGYDSCLPYPNHTYTTLLTVDADVKPSGDISIIDLPGGLFAVLAVRGVENISIGWRQLEQWCKDSEYTFGDQIGLEEYMDVINKQPLDVLHFKLYLSIEA